MKRKDENLMDLPLKHTEQEGVGELVVSHWHTHFELMLFTSGTATVCIGQQSYTVQAGQIVCVPPNRLHQVTAANRCALMGFVFPPPPEQTVWPLTTDYAPVFCDSALSDLLILLHNEYPKKDREVLSGYVALVTVLLKRSCLSNRPVGSDDPTITYLQDHFDLPLRVNDLAKAAHLSPCYFAHRFKADTGLSPMQYVTNLRIGKSMELFGMGLSVKEAAARCGFEDEGYFRKVFKKVAGLSVGAYRKARSLDK